MGFDATWSGLLRGRDADEPHPPMGTVERSLPLRPGREGADRLALRSGLFRDLGGIMRPEVTYEVGLHESVEGRATRRPVLVVRLRYLELFLA